jgi:hypothetical protein
VHVFRNGRARTIKLTAPVHDLAITPDGSVGAAAISGGFLTFIKPHTCDTGPCEEATVRLQIAGTYFITSVRFIDNLKAAVGVIRRSDDKPPVYPSGAILAVASHTGKIVASHDVKLEQPATWEPLVDVTVGAPMFGGHTRRSSFIFEPEPH